MSKYDTSMPRRDLLRSAAVTTAAAAATVPMAAFAKTEAGETKVMTIFREWRSLHEWIDSPATDGMTNEEFDSVCADRREIEERMFSTRSENAMDTLAKLVAFTFYGRDFADDGGELSGIILSEAVSKVDGALVGGAA